VKIEKYQHTRIVVKRYEATFLRLKIIG